MVKTTRKIIPFVDLVFVIQPLAFWEYTHILKSVEKTTPEAMFMQEVYLAATEQNYLHYVERTLSRKREGGWGGELILYTRLNINSEHVP